MFTEIVKIGNLFKDVELSAIFLYDDNFYVVDDDLKTIKKVNKELDEIESEIPYADEFIWKILDKGIRVYSNEKFCLQQNEMLVVRNNDGKVDHYVGLDGDRLFTRNEVTIILKKRINRKINLILAKAGARDEDDLISMAKIGSKKYYRKHKNINCYNEVELSIRVPTNLNRENRYQIITDKYGQVNGFTLFGKCGSYIEISDIKVETKKMTPSGKYIRVKSTNDPAELAFMDLLGTLFKDYYNNGKILNDGNCYELRLHASNGWESKYIPHSERNSLKRLFKKRMSKQFLPNL